MTQNQRTALRRNLLKLAAVPAALLSASPAYAFLDWLAEKAAVNRKKLYEAIPDKPLVDAFYVMLDDGKKEALVPTLAQAGSLLLHAFQSSVSLGEMLYRHSLLLFGPVNARHVENRIRNSEFTDFELRTM